MVRRRFSDVDAIGTHEMPRCCLHRLGSVVKFPQRFECSGFTGSCGRSWEHVGFWQWKECKPCT